MHPVERVHLPERGISVGHLLLEMVMIAFSVLLALGLESWREHRSQQGLAHEALVNVRNELAHNIGAIDAQLPKQREVLDKLRAALRELDAEGKTSAVQAPLRPPLLTAAAWQAALSTQAVSHIDLDTIQAVAGVYEAHRWLDRIEDSWFRLATTPRSNDLATERQWLRSMEYVFLVYIEVEEGLAATTKGVVAVLPAS